MAKRPDDIQLTGVSVVRKQYESTEQLVNRFRSVVKEQGILKDHKLNVMMSREERKNFKEFARSRRFQKKQKRIVDAMNDSYLL